MEKEKVVELLESIRSRLEEKSFSSSEYTSIFKNDTDAEMVVTLSDINRVISSAIDDVIDRGVSMEDFEEAMEILQNG